MDSIQKSFKKKTLVVVVSVFLISLVVVSVSYSSFSNIGDATNNFVVDAKPLTVTFKDNDLFEEQLFVNSDEDGLKQGGKSFSILNNAETDILYHVLIEDTQTVSNKSNIKVSIDGEKPYLLSDLETLDGKIVLKSGIVKKKNQINDVVTHNIKMWTETITENVSFKISVSSTEATDVASSIIKTLCSSSNITPVDSGLLEDAFGNVRYFGSSPNNYVLFNDELWRIVGVFDIHKGDNQVESKLKIVRNENISRAKFITSTNYAFGENLGSLLNNYVVNSLNDNASVLYDYANFYAGGLSDYTNYKATDYYNNEVTAIDSFDRDNLIVSNGGLLTMSDYYYASLDGASGNWLNDGTDYWLLNNNSSNVNNAFFVNTSGSVSEDFVSNNHGIRPVLYLKSTIRIISGDGSATNPYVIK